jgi:hypothetical protein
MPKAYWISVYRAVNETGVRSQFSLIFESIPLRPKLLCFNEEEKHPCRRPIGLPRIAR